MSLSGLRWWHFLVGIVGGLTILLLLFSILSQNAFRFRIRRPAA